MKTSERSVVKDVSMQMGGINSTHGCATLHHRCSIAECNVTDRMDCSLRTLWPRSREKRRSLRFIRKWLFVGILLRSILKCILTLLSFARALGRLIPDVILTSYDINRLGDICFQLAKFSSLQIFLLYVPFIAYVQAADNCDPTATVCALQWASCSWLCEYWFCGLHDPRTCAKNSFSVKLEYAGFEAPMYCIISFYDMKTRARLTQDGHGFVSIHDKNVTIGPVSCNAWYSLHKRTTPYLFSIYSGIQKKSPLWLYAVVVYLPFVV